MPDLNAQLGSLAVGTWVNFVLFTLELWQAKRYFSAYRRDPLVLKLFVAGALLIDAVASVVNAVCVYRYTIVHFGDYSYLSSQGFEIPVYCILTGLVGCMCQSYLMWRTYRLSKNLPLLLVTGLAVIAGPIFSIFTAVDVTIFKEYSQRDKVTTPVVAWLSCEAGADVLIAATLIAYLLSYRSKSDFDDTKGLISRLIFISAESGAFTSLLAIVVLTTYLASKESNVTIGVGFCLGRVYSLTLLLNLNLRVRAHSDDSEFTGTKTTRAFAMSRRANAPVGIMSAINVQHEVDVQIDDDRDVERPPLPVVFLNDKLESENQSHRSWEQ